MQCIETLKQVHYIEGEPFKSKSQSYTIFTFSNTLE